MKTFRKMAFVDYWSTFCPLAIEKGFNVSLSPNMTDNPSYLTLYREPADPVTFQPVFNCPEDFGEPGPHIAVCLFDEGKTAKDYSKYVLNQCRVGKAADKTFVEDAHAFNSYIWQPMAYDLAMADWSQMPQTYIDEWLNWQLHYLERLKALFFHEKRE